MPRGRPKKVMEEVIVEKPAREHSPNEVSVLAKLDSVETDALKIIREHYRMESNANAVRYALVYLARRTRDEWSD